jgi:hypothetical protein
MNQALPSKDDLYLLLTTGCASAASREYSSLESHGLVWCDPASRQIILTARGLQVANSLPTESESIAALIACIDKIRFAWMRIVAAVLVEAGARRDALELCQSIETLGLASLPVRESIETASLGRTEFSIYEQELFGSGAEQPANFPKLLRTLGRSAVVKAKSALVKPHRLNQIDPFDPKSDWCAGRILRMANLASCIPAEQESTTFVLRGDCSLLSDCERVLGDQAWRELMRWVLYRPWCMLLAHIVFTVEAWRAEQISGQMTLELAEDQISNPYEPKRVDVVVTTPDGSEILCGSLGQLVVRVLDRLQVTLLARDEEIERLDERLAGVIRLLLERKVWRFDPRGAGGSRPGYLIDDDFSTSCYRAFGSKYFYRAGSVLTAAIRTSAEQWASEKQAKSRELAGVER